MQKTHTSPTSATHPCPPQAHTLAQAHSEGRLPSSLVADRCAPDLPENKGAQGMEICTPSSLSPTENLGKAKVKRPLMAPRIKAPCTSDLTYTQKKGWELVYARKGNKAIWENNKYFLSIYLFFFFLTFSYIFISLQILSVCLTYILYIFIYQYNASQ